MSSPPLPSRRGQLIRGYVDSFKREVQYVIDVYEDRRSSGRPPLWSDGGEPSLTFISSAQVERDMSRESQSGADIISGQELTELLADATGTTPEEIERGAAELEIAPPEEAIVVDE